MQNYSGELNYETYKQIKYIAEIAKDSITDQLYNVLAKDKNKIDFMESRIKTYDSLIDKMKYKGYELSVNGLLKNINDLIGIRFVCKNLNDVYNIVNDIKKEKKIKVITEKDYISQPKKSGYKSFHLIIEPKIKIMDYTFTVRAEIQVRTYEMQLWANWAHDLIYKKNMRSSIEYVS